MSEPAFTQQEWQIKYYHAARRYLKERGSVEYATATVEEIERIGQWLRYEDYRRAIQPYLEHKARLLCDFYSLRANLNDPKPQWLQERLADWDAMIASVAREFGYEV
jgi:hypothetical protein